MRVINGDACTAVLPTFKLLVCVQNFTDRSLIYFSEPTSWIRVSL